MVRRQPAQSIKSDASSEERDKAPSSALGETGRGRHNLWHRTRQYFGKPENVISLLTLAAVAVYTSLTYFLLNAERESYTRVQRAFVFPAKYVFRLDGAERKIGISVVWKNGGDTPTRNLRISITDGRRDAPLPSDFKFPSDDQKTYGKHPLPILVLGPHASVSGIRRAEIPLSAVPDVNSRREWAYLWGFARYNDVFGSSHITRFCVQITSIGADLVGNTSDVTAAYIPCDFGNCADEECEAEKIPLPDQQDALTAGAAP